MIAAGRLLFKAHRAYFEVLRLINQRLPNEEKIDEMGHGLLEFFRIWDAYRKIDPSATLQSEYWSKSFLAFCAGFAGFILLLVSLSARVG